MIVVRFRDGKDDDLKEWYESLPEGERSRIVRKILRNHLNSPVKINTKLNNNKVNVYKKVIIKEKINNLIKQF